MAHGITLKLREIKSGAYFIPASVWSKMHEDQIDAGNGLGRSGSSYRAARRNFKRLMRKLEKARHEGR